MDDICKKPHLEYLKSVGISQETAKEFGLQSRYDYILYPQIENKTLLGYKGISIVKDENTGKRKMFFDENAKAPLWHEPHFQKEKHIIFVEGEKDCMRLTETIKQVGKQNEYIAITITTGAKTIPQNTTQKIQALNPKEISIIYDNDTAGKEGSKKLANELLTVKEKINIYSFNQENKEGYDITDFLNEGGKFTDLWQLEKEIITKEKPTLEASVLFNNPKISFQFGDLQQEVPPIQWLIQNFLAENKVGSVVAKGSTGKSWFLLQLAVSIASGMDFMGMKNPNNGGNVLYIMGEEDKDDIHRRISSIKTSYKNSITNESEVNKNLSFLCVNGQNVTLNAQSKLRKDLKLYIQIHEPKLIILDPAIRFFEGDENNSRDATKFVEILEELKNMGTTILFAHHTGKMMSDTLDQHSARGSSAFIDASRWNIVLKKIHRKDADKYCFESDESFIDQDVCELYINAEIVKCNGFKPIESEFTFKRDVNGVLQRSQKLILKN